MSHGKWRETKQQLIWWPDLALLGCYLVSFHFLCDILSTGSVCLKFLQRALSEVEKYVLLVKLGALFSWSWSRIKIVHAWYSKVFKPMSFFVWRSCHRGSWQRGNFLFASKKRLNNVAPQSPRFRSIWVLGEGKGRIAMGKMANKRTW